MNTNLVDTMNANAKSIWKKVCDAHCMDGSDEDYAQWKEETQAILNECSEAAYDIAQTDGITAEDLETLLWYAF